MVHVRKEMDVQDALSSNADETEDVDREADNLSPSLANEDRPVLGFSASVARNRTRVRPGPPGRSKFTCMHSKKRGVCIV